MDTLYVAGISKKHADIFLMYYQDPDTDDETALHMLRGGLINPNKDVVEMFIEWMISIGHPQGRDAKIFEYAV
jgi:hypothetical protein